MTLEEFAQIGELIAALGAVLAVFVGLSQLRQQVRRSGQEREETLKAIEIQLSLSRDQQEQAKKQLELTRNLFEVEFVTRIEDRFDRGRLRIRKIKHAKA